MMATNSTYPSGTYGNSNFFDQVFAAREDKEIRIVLAGKTGEGKSAMGNAILAQPTFVAKRSMKSETSVCTTGERNLDSRRLIVVDTPGLFDTTADPEMVAKEIGKAVMMSSPGPHCFIITISARNRFTEEAQQTVNLLCDIFGGDVLKYCIVVFTNEDAILDEDMSFEQWLPEQTGQLPSLANLINSCQRRVMAINSKCKSPAILESKVRQLVSIISVMIAANNGRVYTNDMYKAAEAAARAREEQKLREAAEKDADFTRQIQQLEDKMKKTEESLRKAEKDQQKTKKQLKDTQQELKREKEEYEANSKRLMQEREENKKKATDKAVTERESTRADTAAEADGWWGTVSRVIKPVLSELKKWVPIIFGGGQKQGGCF